MDILVLYMVGLLVASTGMLSVLMWQNYQINQRLSFINLQIQNLMATEQEWIAILDRIDVATTNIAGDIRGIKDELANAGLPKEVEDRISARLEAKAVQLEALAADTEDPTPEVPEEPTPEV